MESRSRESSQELLVEKIAKLKERRNAILLAHNYQRPEVQDIADFVGDSLGLSRQAAASEADVIVFCGVHFMAETAAMLCPEKTVLLPDESAGCPMADMIYVKALKELKKQHTEASVLCYINTSAEIKAESDVCCTSANAVKLIREIPGEEVIFVPDKSLAAYCAGKTNKKVILYDGYCPTHHRILASEVQDLKAQYPEAEVVVHPECTPDVIALSDQVFGTGGMCNYVKETQAPTIILGTENGMIHRLKRENPNIQYIPASQRAICPNMKKTTLEKILWALEDMAPVVSVPPSIAEAAKQAIERMVA